MKIYIDEAGPFIPPQRRSHHCSLVLALIVPGATEASLFYEFLRLRDTWPHQAVEIKGSKLDEHQCAGVMNVLATHDVVAEYLAIDMALHPANVVDELKYRQAGALTENLTPLHTELVTRQLHEHAESIRHLPNPLFVQAVVTIELILSMLETVINYYAQRRPTELGEFAWMSDRKDRSITDMERLWSTLILPFSVPRSAQRPFPRVHGFDYSHFSRYEIGESTANEQMQQHLRWMRETLPSSKPLPTPLRCIDAQRLWTEKRSFEDSKHNLGLQLADITAATLCRAFNGHLQRIGWEPAAQLLIRKKTAPFIHLSEAAGNGRGLEQHAAGVWRQLDRRSQAMFLQT